MHDGKRRDGGEHHRDRENKKQILQADPYNHADQYRSKRNTSHDRPPARAPIVRVPAASTAAMASRPIVRRVGGWLAIPAIVLVGAPFVLEVPGLGWVYIPEEEYPAVYDLLLSDDPNDVERAYLRLQDFQQADKSTSLEPSDQPAAQAATRLGAEPEKWQPLPVSKEPASTMSRQEWLRCLENATRPQC